MKTDRTAYLDTSALAKWYLNEQNSEAFTAYIKKLDIAVISGLTVVEMRSLLARRRRMGEIDVSLESTIYAAFQDDIANGHLQLYPMEESCLLEAANLIALYQNHPIKTLDALHLSVVRHNGIETVATADRVMADVLSDMELSVEDFARR